MGTAKGGYHTQDGTRVPSVTTVLGRFKESGALMHWAWRMGKEGKDYRQERDAAATAGTIAHDMVEQWIHKKPFTAPNVSADIMQKAEMSFQAFREWEQQTNLVVTHTELALVSEKYRFGGTMDAILVRTKRSMGDWKTSNGIYPDYLAQIAAYGILWDEHYPNDPITGGYHLLRFDKEYGDFHAHWWAELAAGRVYFLACLEAYRADQELKKRAK